jgi:hypothetical protein
VTQTIEVKGRKFDVELDQHFWLRVAVDGDVVTAENVEKLRAAISNKLRQKRVDHNIAVVIKHGSSYFDGTGGAYVRAILRGKNSRTGHALMTINGKAEQIERPEIISRGEKTTDEQIAEMNRLLKAANEAHAAHAKYVRAVKDATDVRRTLIVDELLAAATDEAEQK